MNFIIIGHKGRLGSQIYEKAKQTHNVIGIEKDGDIFNLENYDFDAIIDVSSPENSVKSADFAEKHNIPLIVGCTGHTKTQIDTIFSKSERIPVMICPNFSIGICVLCEALKQILKAPITDAYITELHHKNKNDSPSGTAKLLENILKNKTNLHETTSIRQGKIVGKHRIDLYMENEHIVLSHSAESRECFADGAVFALVHIARMPAGIYDLKDFLDI